MYKPGVSDHLTKWTVELSEFHLDIVLAKAIKGQADFIVELAPKSVVQSEEWCIMHMDGSTSKEV